MRAAPPAPTARAETLPLDRAALFLDLDGTLTPIRRRPADVAPDPRRTALLAFATERLQGRVAVISGRPIAELDRLLEEAAPCVAGSHGLERRTAAGVMHSTAPHPDLPAAGAAFRAFAASNGGLPIEHKPCSVALHFRERPQIEGPALALAARLAAYTGLTIQPGKMMVELKTPGPDKAAGLRAFMTEAPFAGATPIYLGDDQTDEPAFAAAAEVGGLGVLVGPPRPTRAVARLDSVDHALHWLEASLRGDAFRITAARWAG